MRANRNNTKPGSPRISHALFWLLVTFSACAVGQPRPMQEGQHYAIIDPAISVSTNADTIEVLDVFWYGCPQCAEFEPMMTYYGGEIRGDLVMRRMPAIWNAVMKTHARVYFTALELGIADKAHPAAFAYIQEQQLPLNNTEQAQAFFGTLDVSAADFSAAWESDKVEQALATAAADTTAAGIARLPALIVNGQYRVLRNEHVTELPELVVTVNQLIRTLRDQRRID